MAKQTKAWSNKIPLNSLELSILEGLRRKAIAAEHGLNEECYQLLCEKGVVLPDKKNTEHGYYIKKFFHYYFNKDSSVYDSEQVYNSYLIKYGRALGASLKSSMGKEEILNCGIVELYKELEKAFDSNSKKNSKARGHYSEMVTFKTLYDNLKKEFGDRVVMMDTSPKDRGNSVLYDIQIIINGDDTAPSLDIDIENKIGVSEPYINSVFHFGDFSSNAFIFDTQVNVYENLINSLQKSFQAYVNKASDFTQPIDDWVQKTIRYWAIQYIDWKLRRHYPIFMSDRRGGKINLSSEIIEGFKGAPGGKVEYSLADMIKFIDIDASKYYNTRHFGGGRYIYDKNNLSAKTLESYLKDEDFDSQWVKKATYTQKFSNTKISPSFKASVWYGKQ